MPPFSTLDVRLKQLRLDDLEDGFLRALDALFPGFWDPLVGEAAPGEQTRSRRFSGGALGTPLPRGRYKSLCQDDTNNDQSTLCREIEAYRGSRDHFHVQVFDTAVPSDREIVEKQIGMWCMDNVIKIVVEDSTYELMPALAPGGAIQMHGGVYAFDAQYRCARERVDSVIDLRLSATRHWLVQELWSGLPFGAELGREERWAGILGRMFARPLGGDAFTDEFGLWLRGLGAQGLVYPSARSNAGVTIEDGAVKSWNGFNFVDFRDLDQITRDIRRPRMFYDDNTCPWPNFVHAYPNETRFQDSWRIGGVEQGLSDLYMSGGHLGARDGRLGSKIYESTSPDAPTDEQRKVMREIWIDMNDELQRRGALPPSETPTPSSTAAKPTLPFDPPLRPRTKSWWPFGRKG